MNTEEKNKAEELKEVEEVAEATEINEKEIEKVAGGLIDPFISTRKRP